MAKPLPVRATLLLLAALALVFGVGAAAPARYEYDPAGRRVALKLPNGVKTTYAHDGAGRLTKVESKNAAGNVISAFGYTLDATGNRTAMDVTLNGVHNRIEYAFDDAYRLTRETRKDAAGNVIYDEGLTYDPVGNRLSRNRVQNGMSENTVYAYNAANQLLTETTNGVTTAYGYDKNGNNTTISTPAANGAPAKNIAMTYDWLNRQTRWTDGTRTESTVFAGADWKRASTTVSGAGVAAQTVKYLYDGDNVLADYDATNALTAFYVTPGLDQNLSVIDASGQTAYYTQDGLGSVRTLTAENGAILNRYDYTAFGETFATNTANTVSNRYTYTAREQSPLAAHGAPMYYRWRNYAPATGRFMWRDPIGYQGWVNVYGYVGGMSTRCADAFGLKAIVLDFDVSRIKDPPSKSLFQTTPPNGWDELKERYESVIENLERDWTDELFDKWKNRKDPKGKPWISFNREQWKGTREELIATIKRELESYWLVQTRGGIAEAVDKLNELRQSLDRPWDELGFGAHGTPNGHFVLPTGNHAPQDPELETNIRNAGMSDDQKRFEKVCYRCML